MNAPDTCPACLADLTGALIPEADRAHFGNATHFTRTIAVYDRKSDRTIAWQCPLCAHQWERSDG